MTRRVGSDRDLPPERAEDPPHRVRDLPESGADLYGRQNRGHEVLPPAACLLQDGQRIPDRATVPLLAEGRETLPLRLLDLRVDRQQARRLRLPDRELVHPDDDPILPLDLLLVPEG